jgi:hypothetical protein
MARLATYATLFVVLIRGSVSADMVILDPANLHINGPSGFAQSAGGTDWVTLPTFNGVFNIQDVSSSSEVISPWHLILAVPNFSGTLLDNITKIGTTSVNISPLFEATLTSGSAYDALGISGADASVSFTNFVTADKSIVGGLTPTSFGLYDFTVTPAALALLPKVVDEVDISGKLPTGTVIFGYGFDAGGTLYSTAFTNAGVVQQAAISTPEPSSLITALIGVIGVIGYAGRRYRRRMRAIAAVA